MGGNYMDDMIQVLCMKCPKHKMIELKSNRKRSFNISVANQTTSKPITMNDHDDNSPKDKIQFTSPIFYCDKCRKYYIYTEQLKNNEERKLKDSIGTYIIRNCNNKIVHGKVSIEQEDALLNLKERQLLKRIEAVSSGLKIEGIKKNSIICPHNGHKLLSGYDVNIQAKLESKSIGFTVEGYYCPKCKIYYIDKGIIKSIINRLVHYSDLTTISVKNHMTDIDSMQQRIEKISKKYDEELKNNIAKAAGIDITKVFLVNEFPEKCKDKSSIDNKKSILNVNVNETMTSFDVAFCKYCHNIYFISDDFYKYLLINYDNSIEEIFKTIEYSFYQGFMDSFIPSPLHEVLYKEKYGNEFNNSLIIHAIQNNKIKKAIKICGDYGIDIKNIQNKKESDTLNKELIKVMGVNSIYDALLKTNYEQIKKICSIVSSHDYSLQIFENGSVSDSDEMIEVVYSYFISTELTIDFVREISLNQVINNPVNTIIESDDYKTTCKIVYEDIELVNIILDNEQNIKEIIDLLEWGKNDDDLNIFDSFKNNYIWLAKDNFKNILADKTISVHRKSYKNREVDFFEFNIKHEGLIYKYRKGKGVLDGKNGELIVSCGDMIHYYYEDKDSEMYSQYYLIERFKNDYNKSGDDQVRVLDVADFLVRTTVLQCTLNEHELVRINAIIQVKNNIGTTEVEVPAYYCAKCNRYYILERYYRQVKKYGYICCRVDEYESLIKSTNSIYGKLNERSILMNYGYTVDKKVGLSDKQRQDILSFMIDNNIIKKNKIINYLEWFITLNKEQPFKQDAVIKWKRDIKYVQSHEKVAYSVYAKSIIAPINKIKII